MKDKRPRNETGAGIRSRKYLRYGTVFTLVFFLAGCAQTMTREDGALKGAAAGAIVGGLAGAGIGAGVGRRGLDSVATIPIGLAAGAVVGAIIGGLLGYFLTEPPKAAPRPTSDQIPSERRNPQL